MSIYSFPKKSRVLSPTPGVGQCDSWAKHNKTLSYEIPAQGG